MIIRLLCWHDNAAHPFLQAQAAYDTVKKRVDALAEVINAAEDEIFGEFCEEIGVENIREYEERQLKLAQAESEARLQFDTQIARLTHAYVWAHAAIHEANGISHTGHSLLKSRSR